MRRIVVEAIRVVNEGADENGDEVSCQVDELVDRLSVAKFVSPRDLTLTGAEEIARRVGSVSLDVVARCRALAWGEIAQNPWMVKYASL